MKEIHFVGITVWKAAFNLRFVFSHNLAVRDQVETLLLSIKTSNGGIGYGQALPRAYLTGETLDSVLADIRGRWWPELAKLALPADADFATVVGALQPVFEQADALRKNASYAAVDIAALDAFTTGQGIPAAFPPPADPARRRDLPLVGVIPAGTPGRSAGIAGLLRLLGYRRFKVKIGRNAAMDERRLAAVRKAIGASNWLAVDANAAWEWDEAIERMRRLGRYDVALVEEPLAAASAADFIRLERCSGIPVLADESLCTLADARSLLSRGTPSWWNLRLSKNGGFAGWRNFSRLAAERGITIYGGVLVGETSILAAAARAAWSSDAAVSGEYGFPRIFLQGDPFRGGPGGFTGRMAPPRPATPGLGVRLRESALPPSAELLWKEG
ncbi:MAG: hypothetical protein FWG74_03465 [Planctomycetes bacterium]|nr:hypothetical protein [Planctomycetota bacterium]